MASCACVCFMFKIRWEDSPHACCARYYRALPVHLLPICCYASNSSVHDVQGGFNYVWQTVHRLIFRDDILLFFLWDPVLELKLQFLLCSSSSRLK